MKIEIKHWWTGSILFEGDFSSVAEAVVAAVKKGADLGGADLGGADLRSADLGGADLGGANLRSADLGGANLRSADLRSADLGGANLRSADLGGANLRSADLRSADLGGANLRSADLRSADLRSANLRSADLGGADLRSANLRSADLGGAKNAEFAIASTRILPEGSIIGWKKLKNEIIAKLLIPETSRRSHAFGRKCRTESAIVLAMFEADGNAFDGVGVSSYDSTFEYRVGATVKPKEPFAEDYTNECASGIHFFITREEAAAYSL